MFGRATITLGIGPHSSLMAVFEMNLGEPVPPRFSFACSGKEPLGIKGNSLFYGPDTLPVTQPTVSL